VTMKVVPPPSKMGY